MTKKVSYAGMILICMMMFLSCQGKDGAIGPEGPTIGHFTAYAYSQGGTRYANNPQLLVYFDQCRNIPTITANGDTLDYQLYSYMYTNRMQPIPAESIYIEASYTMVNGNEGRAYTSFMMPHRADIISPDTGTIALFSPGEDVITTWHSTSGATCYQVYFFVHIDYWIDQYSHTTFSLSRDTTIIDTSLVIAGNRIIPGNYFSIGYISGTIEIYARRSAIQSGDDSDFGGDGYGFVVAYSYSGTINFEVVDNVRAGILNVNNMKN